MRLHRLITLVLLLLCPTAFGAEYFVRAGGSNSNSGGSPDQAWATVAHAASRVAAGDTVYVGAGSYAGQVYMDRRAGTEDNPIRFVADTTGEHTGDAGAVSLTNGAGLIHLRRSDHVRFVGFRMEVSGGNTVYADGSDGVVLDRCTIVSGGAGVHGANRSTLTVSDTVITVSNGHGIYLSGGSLSLSGSAVTVTAGTNSPMFGGQRPSVTVEQSSLVGGGHVVYLDSGVLTMVNTVIANGTNNGVHAGWGAELTMVHCTVHGVGQDGLYAGGGGVTLRNTIFSDAGRYAIFRASSARIEGSHNLFHGWGEEMTYGFTPEDPVVGDPRFVDAAGLEFGVLPGSAARDAGSDAADYTTIDLVGGVRPQGAGWDIGAYEGTGRTRTVYVRTNGSDSNSGRTPQRAFRTIQRAIREATGAGYTIYVGPGTYAEGLVIGTGAGSAAASGTASEPNRLIADTSGAETGDDPGPVVLSGNNRSIARGLFVSRRSHWHAEGFRFTGHGQTAVQVQNGGMTLSDSVVDVPRNYGVLMQGNAPMAVTGNVFNFAGDSGHTVVMELRGGGDSVLRIENNRMHNDGVQYLATGYRTRLPSRFGAAQTWRYGIYANGRNNPRGSVIIRNNIVSDKYVGIYGISDSSGPLLIANNTVTGCSWPVYTVGGPQGSIVANNIVASSYYGVMTDGLAPVVALCEFDLSFDMSRLARRNFTDDIITSDPRFAEPSAGNFALIAGSECIDAGTEQGATSEDIAGNQRPDDGDNDGIAAHDLGAMEQVVARDRVRVVRWREISPLGED